MQSSPALRQLRIRVPYVLYVVRCFAVLISLSLPLSQQSAPRTGPLRDRHLLSQWLSPGLPTGSAWSF